LIFKYTKNQAISIDLVDGISGACKLHGNGCPFKRFDEAIDGQWPHISHGVSNANDCNRPACLMLILQRHLLRQAMLGSGMTLAVLMLVVLALFLAELLADSASGQLPLISALGLLALRIPEALLWIGPLALLTGLLLALGQLHDQHELTVARAAGLRLSALLKPLLGWVAAWSMALLLLAGWVAPWAAERGHGVIIDAARHALVGALSPGQFDHLDQGRTTLYLAEADVATQTLTEVLVHHISDQHEEWLSARSGLLWLDPSDQSRYLSLFDGHQIQHGQTLEPSALRVMTFARNDIRLPAPEGSDYSREMMLPLPELWPASDALAWREWHWRWSASLAALVLGMLALPLAMRPPRQGRYPSLIVALIAYLVYSNLIHAGLVRMERLEALSGPGLWPVHGAALLMAAALWFGLWRRW
jgi:lipopolysaccharide export system permease protein